MWLEPATEPIDTADNLKEPSKAAQNQTTSNKLIEATIIMLKTIKISLLKNRILILQRNFIVNPTIL